MFHKFISSQNIVKSTIILSRSYARTFNVIDCAYIPRLKGVSALPVQNLHEPVALSGLLRHLGLSCRNITQNVNNSNNLRVYQQQRFYRTGRSNPESPRSDESPQPEKPKQLMDFPWILQPNIFFAIRNWIFTNLIIRPYMDNEFSLASFKTGAIQALVHVSQEIAKGNFPALEGLMTKSSIEEVKSNFSRLSLKERVDLAVPPEDIYFSFPYQIGVMYKNEGGSEERVFVEITMCYYVFKGLKDHLKKLENDNSGIMVHTNLMNDVDRMSVANYRFIREYTKGVEDDWTVNVANHFKLPTDKDQ